MCWYQRMISASVCGERSRTVPPGIRLSACSADSTLRKVTGSSAGPLGPSANRSTTPKGAAANLTSGGMGPVRTASGKLLALLKVRPASSTKPAGKTICMAACSGRLPAKRTDSVLLELASSALNCGLMVSLPYCNTTCLAHCMGTGAEKFTVTGRIGIQAACALGRSQLKLASSGDCTLKLNDCGLLLISPPAPL